MIDPIDTAIDIFKRRWEPIESAPKDGTEVLVWCRGEAIPFVMHFTSREYLEREYGDPDYMEEGWYLSYAYPDHLPECTWPATHWMPLPQPPLTAERSEA